MERKAAGNRGEGSVLWWKQCGMPDHSCIHHRLGVCWAPKESKSDLGINHPKFGQVSHVADCGAAYHQPHREPSTCPSWTLIANRHQRVTSRFPHLTEGSKFESTITMNRLFGSKNTAPKPTLNSAISNVSHLISFALRST
jgi:hypothetical protein